MSATDNIFDWITGPLSTVSADFGNMPPCPYAKKALLNNRVVVQESTGINLEVDLCKVLTDFPVEKDVVVIALNPNDVTADRLTILASKHSSDTFVVLEDHPAEEEKIGNTQVNNGVYALLLIQPRCEIEKARVQLAKTPYYTYFEQDYKQELFSR